MPKPKEFANHFDQTKKSILNFKYIDHFPNKMDIKTKKEEEAK